MAFNPFHHFRKHQKTLMAGMVFVAMAMFILQFSPSSGGDFFSEVTNVIASRNRHNEVTKLYGKPVTFIDIDYLRQQRILAGRYMAAVMQNAVFKLEGTIHENMENLEPSTKATIQRTRSDFFRNLQQFRFNTKYLLAFYQQSLQQQMQDLKSKEKHNDAEALSMLLTALALQSDLLERGENFFEGSATKTPDLLDFMIWRHQAEKLGIQMDAASVKKIINDRTNSVLKAQDLTNVRNQVLGHSSFSIDQLIRALGDEFRVEIAKQTMLPANQQIFPACETPTPHELWKFYRSETTRNELAILPIPVNHADFLARVPEPTDEDLKKLYEIGKFREFRPDDDLAAFKQPERMMVQWAHIDPQSKALLKKADQINSAVRWSDFLGRVAIGASSDSLPALTAAVVLPLTHDLPLIGHYEEQRQFFRSPSWLGSEFRDPSFAYRNSNFYRAETFASAAGLAMANARSFAPAGLGAIAAMHATASQRELMDRAGHAAEFIASAADPMCMMPVAVFLSTPREEYLPMSQFRRHLRDVQRERMANDIVGSPNGPIHKLMNELEKKARETRRDQIEELLRNDPELLKDVATTMVTGIINPWPAGLVLAAQSGPETLSRLYRIREAGLATAMLGISPWVSLGILHGDDYERTRKTEEHLFKELKALGVEIKSAEALRDRHDIPDDPGLYPLLKERFTSHRAFTDPKEREQFANMFFRSFSGGMDSLPEELFVPRKWAENMLYWKSAQTPAYVPSFAEARDKVLARYRFEKARAFAKEEADRIAEAARKNPTDPDRNLKDSKFADKLIELKDVARLLSPSWGLVGVPSAAGLDVYKLPESKIPNAGEALVKKLQDMKAKGEVLVVPDQPESNYFVVVLKERFAPTIAMFQEDMSIIDRLQQLQRHYEEERKARTHYRTSFLKQLRAAAGKVDEDGNLVLTEEAKKRDEKGTADE